MDSYFGLFHDFSITQIACFLCVTVVLSSRILCQQNCPLVAEVSHSPEESFLTQNVSLYCTTNDSSADSMTWRMKRANAADYQTVYYAYPQDKSQSRPEQDFENNVTGKFIEPLEYNHMLTIIETEPLFNDSTWICTVTTPSCILGKDSDELNVILKSKYCIWILHKDSRS